MNNNIVYSVFLRDVHVYDVYQNGDVTSYIKTKFNTARTSDSLGSTEERVETRRQEIRQIEEYCRSLGLAENHPVEYYLIEETETARDEQFLSEVRMSIPEYASPKEEYDAAYDSLYRLGFAPGPSEGALRKYSQDEKMEARVQFWGEGEPWIPYLERNPGKELTYIYDIGL